VVETLIQNNEVIDIWSLYLYAMKSPVTRQKYQKRLEIFFDFIKVERNTIEEKSKVFFKSQRKNAKHGLLSIY